MTEEKETVNGSINPEVTIGWIDKVGAVVKKYGLKDVAIFAMVLFLVVVVGRIIVSPEIVYDKMESLQQQAHTEAVMKRINNEPKIRESLANLRSELKADRVYILETHNGGNNLANLPFIYVDLTYAEPKGSLAWMESEYKNVRLSRYPWASEVYKSTYWSGTLSSLEELDPELYHRLKNEGVSFMAVMMMYGTYNPSGVVGVVYTEDDYPDDETIKRTLIRYTGSLSALFNNEK